MGGDTPLWNPRSKPAPTIPIRRWNPPRNPLDHRRSCRDHRLRGGVPPDTSAGTQTHSDRLRNPRNHRLGIPLSRHRECSPVNEHLGNYRKLTPPIGHLHRRKHIHLDRPHRHTHHHRQTTIQPPRSGRVGRVDTVCINTVGEGAKQQRTGTNSAANFEPQCHKPR